MGWDFKLHAQAMSSSIYNNYKNLSYFKAYL
jgi:hypothetical protein